MYENFEKEWVPYIILTMGLIYLGISIFAITLIKEKHRFIINFFIVQITRAVADIMLGLFLSIAQASPHPNNFIKVL